MTTLLAELSHVDGRVSEEVTDLRWWPLTDAMVLLSSWWVKGPLFVLAALAVDFIASRRTRAVPWATLLTLASVLVSSLASTLAKLAFERPRPPHGDAGIDPVGALPSSWSFPSGHATTAFAAAAALGMLCPRLRLPALAVAAAVAVSRVYLGVHYAFDVLAGAVLGAAIGVLLVLLARRAVPVRVPVVAARA